MDLAYLEEIVVFARYLNYSRAAKELYISQPALSQHVAKVEAELGFNLFSHDGTNRPTVAGQVFCSEAASLLASWHDVVERCSAIARQEAEAIKVLDVRMALGSLAACDARPAVVTYIPCETVRASSEFDALDRHEVDVSFACAPVPDPSWFVEEGYIDGLQAYAFVPLAQERCVLRVLQTSPLAARASVALDELEAYTLVYNNMPLYHTCDRAIQVALAATGHSFKSITGIGNAKTSILSTGPWYASVLIETAVNLIGQTLEPQLATVDFADFELSICPFAVVRASDIGFPAYDFAASLGTIVDGR